MKFHSYKSFLLESQKDLTFFFDMDGVLADFERGIEEDPRYPELKAAKEKLFSYVKQHHPEVQRMTVDDIKFILPKGNAELKSLYDTAHDLIHEIADQKGFFLNLKPIPGGKEMLKEAQIITGKLPNILTAPTKSEWCKDEKFAWMTKHFNAMFDKFYCDKKKEKYATSKKDVLIDDRKKYYDAFTQAGGTCIMYKDPNQVISEMRSLGK